MAVITDPVADLLTRIRNANVANHTTVDVPASRMKFAVAQILKDEGFIKEIERTNEGPQGTLRITLKYGPNKEKIITGLRRISRPGLRVYTTKTEIPRVLGGLGLVVMSTSKGIMSGKRAK
ncbi:MAG: 30S ribosomal protein S8, partial [Candidatus Eremiobacteraeota bacterium]|nr:30S ribosomal protein S8 [Candidatus Eremiobacteraeota bacterium]